MKVIVIGEAMLDSYLSGTTDRLCREAPVPVVSVTAREDVPGGAANTALNLRGLGAEVFFLSVTGRDAEGELLMRALEAAGVSTGLFEIDPGRQTLAKQRVIAASQMVVRFDQGSTAPLSPQMENALINKLEEIYPACDAVIVSDYDYGILTPPVIQALARLQAGNPRIFVVDSKRLPAYHEIPLTAVKPNYEEALELLGLRKPAAWDEQKPAGEHSGLSPRLAQILERGQALLDVVRTEIAAITLDQEGALIFQRQGTPYRTYAHPAPYTRAAGAGDTFISAFTLALAAGAGAEKAAEIASAAAEIVVGKDGTAACHAGELKAHFSTEEKYFTDVFQLAARLLSYRREGRRIVFTNGCFDILHKGHITYLNQAKSLGDILIVGLNSDASVRRLKGSTRPINSLEDRAQVLAALSCVDHIVPFDGDTPHELIRVIQPEMFVKGGDYKLETLPEAYLVTELGGEVCILPYVQDQSTTGIIARIQASLGPAPVRRI